MDKNLQKLDSKGLALPALVELADMEDWEELLDKESQAFLDAGWRSTETMKQAWAVDLAASLSEFDEEKAREALRKGWEENRLESFVRKALASETSAARPYLDAIKRLKKIIDDVQVRIDRPEVSP